MNKKIAFISHQAFALINFRDGLIRLLITSGYEVYALAPDFTSDSRKYLVAMGATPLDYQLSRTGTNPMRDFLSAIELFHILRSLHVDVAFAFSIKPSIYGMIAAWFARVPKRICMIEGLGHVFIVGLQKVSLLRNLLKASVLMLYKIGFATSSSVIFLNNDDLNYFLKKKLVSSKKCSNIGGIGVNLANWTFSIPKIDPIRFIFIGRLLREKGILEFIEAVRKVKGEFNAVQFIVLGDVDTNPSSITRSQINQWVDEGLVEWHGHVPVKNWLGISSVFVLPSHREGVPRTTQEAMAIGRPVITTDVPGCRDTVIDGLNGFLVEPFNSDALANAMKKFIESPNLIMQMGVQSRRLAEKWFDEKQKNQMILNIIKEKKSQFNWLKRVFDVGLSIFCLIIFLCPMILIALFIRLSDRGSSIYWSQRVGSGGELFWMPKFRSMKLNTPVVASHLLADNSESFLIFGGSFLRKSSLDELPQLWSILRGDMSFVGPRPALFNQIDLIEKRRSLGIDQLKPGLTGWAQVNGRDDIGLDDKIRFDEQYLNRQSFWFDVYILWLTFLKVLGREGVSH